MTGNLALYIFIVTATLRTSSSSIFGASNLWIKGSSKSLIDDSSKSKKLEIFGNVLKLRGGSEEEKPKTTEKIKGCCIGIDLGTTYRYSEK